MALDMERQVYRGGAPDGRAGLKTAKDSRIWYILLHWIIATRA